MDEWGLSAREADEDVVLGLGIGADEFVTKPCAPAVLVARIHALLRRGRLPRPETVSFGPCVMDVEGYSLMRGREPVALSTKEFEVLRHLVTHPGEAMTPDANFDLKETRGCHGSMFEIAFIRRKKLHRRLWSSRSSRRVTRLFL